MTFRQQIETSSLMDQSFLLENFTKESLFKSYQEQLNISHKINFKNGELKEEIERLKNEVKALKLQMG